MTREEAIKDIEENILPIVGGKSLRMAIDALRQPERKKGHWIRHPEQRNIFNGKTIECSECHEKYTVQYVEDELFCRHCGAEMGGQDER